MTKSMLPDRLPSRVKHSWRCVHRGPLVETTRRDATGVVRVVERCQECGGTDLVERVRAEAAERGGPT